MLNANFELESEKIVSNLEMNFPEFFKAIQEHTKKHCWVYYVYSGPAFEEANFLELIKTNLESGINPIEKLEQLEKEKQAILMKKKDIFEELNPDEFHTEILDLAAYIIWAKPRRKDLQSKLYYHMIEGFLKEIASRLDLSRNQILNCPFDLMEQALKTGEIDKSLLDSIYEHHVVLSEGEDVNIYYEEEAREKAKEIVYAVEELSDSAELKGTPACKGKARGEVSIVNSPKDMYKMNQGGILISTATTPSIVSAMKKAAAIVTDEGGITCHASIVSRELGIPCVVGTKIVTRTFKDGDIVEVDANNGIVRKIIKP